MERVTSLGAITNMNKTHNHAERDGGVMSEEHNRDGGVMKEENSNGETIKKVSWVDTIIPTHEMVSRDATNETDAGGWTVVMPKGRTVKAKR